MFLFLIGNFLKRAGHLHIAVFLGLSGKIVVTVARLGFAGKGGEQILFGAGAFQ